MQQTDQDDVVSAASELAGIASNFYLFGCTLGIERERLNQLRGNHRYEQKQGLQAVLDEYVLENHNTIKFGRPTWRNIVAAVSNSMGGNNHRLAKEIAAKHACKCILTVNLYPPCSRVIIYILSTHAY